MKIWLKNENSPMMPHWIKKNSECPSSATCQATPVPKGLKYAQKRANIGHIYDSFQKRAKYIIDMQKYAVHIVASQNRPEYVKNMVKIA